MAKIILEPGEQFEHYHAGPSVTELLEGSVRLDMRDQIQTLKTGEKIDVPAAAAHTLVNTGATPAAVFCSH